MKFHHLFLFAAGLLVQTVLIFAICGMPVWAAAVGLLVAIDLALYFIGEAK